MWKFIVILLVKCFDTQKNFAIVRLLEQCES